MRTELYFLWRKITYVALCRLALFFYILIPFVLKIFPSFFLQSVFSSKYKGPAVYARLTDPDKDWGFLGATNHYISSLSGNTIGLWHLPPKGATTPLNKAARVVLYCHGKAGNRATGHRIGFYDVLRGLGFHVVTFDYSGFGDSTGAPDGMTVTKDTISVYRWLHEQVQRTDAVFLVWGHSLGSGIATTALAEMSQRLGDMPQNFMEMPQNLVEMSQNSAVPMPHGVILESTFTNLYEASKHSTLFRLLDVLYPYVFRKMFKSSARGSHMEFEIDKNLPLIKSHMLILHSDDDPKISVKLAQKLYDSVTKIQNSKVVTLKLYRIGAKYGLGHNLVYTFEHLREILINYTDMVGGDSYISHKLRFEQVSI